MSQRLVYLCDWLPPDFGAVGQYSVGFARDYAAQGWDVTLIGLASRAGSVTSERVDGGGRLTVRRLEAAPCDRARLGRRLRWTLATNLRLLSAALPRLRAADEVIFTGSPPFLLHVLVPLNALLRRRLVYRITDFHPECLMATYDDRVPSWLRLFHRLTCALRRRVHAFQVLGEDQARRLAAIGIPAERVTLKPDPSPVAVRGDELPLEVPAEIAGHTVLLYSGNWGVAHEVDTFVDGYVRHHRHGSGRVALWLNAVGQGADAVEQRLRAAGIPVSRGRPVPLARLPRLLVTPDAHLITLKDAFVGYVLPSKVHGCLASGRPVLFIGSEASDVHRLGTQTAANGSERYRRVRVGDAAGVAQALEALADDARRPSFRPARPTMDAVA